MTFAPFQLGSAASTMSVADILVGSTIVACVGVNLWSQYCLDEKKKGNTKPVKVLNRNFICSRRNVTEGRWWTLLSHTVTHVGFTHLAVNMFTLWSFGRPMITLYGPLSYLALWVGGGLMGGVLTLEIQRRTREGFGFLGASGSICALTAAMACVAPFLQVEITPIPIPIPLWLYTICFAGFSVYAQSNGHFNSIDHMGHFGGLAFGAVFWFLRLRRMRPLGRIL